MPVIQSSRSSAGFTLVEIAVVLLIVGLLMAGLLPALTSQIEQQRVSETRKLLEDVRQALLGFAVINGRLPCAADPAIPSGTTNAGMETFTAGSCTHTTGVLPWATLGLPETDAWGRRLTYRVAPHFADDITANTYGTGCTPATNLATSSFALCSPGEPDVYDRSGGTLVFRDVPAIVVSHGINGLGGFTPAGNKLTDGTGDELENSDNDAQFVHHEFATAYDDLVIWLSPHTLVNRMVAAGKLP